MNRVYRLAGLARHAAKAVGTPSMAAGSQACNFSPVQVQQMTAISLSNTLNKASRSFSSGVVTAEDVEHATGLERQELEAAAEGKSMFQEDWLNAPWGTEDNPVEVTSSLHERIVGVPDPYDDSIIWWGTIEEGQPPKQIVDTGEFFVLKKVEASEGHGGHSLH